MERIQSAIAKARAMQVQPVNAQTFAHRRRLAHRGEQHLGPGLIGQPPLQITVHDGEGRPRPFQRGKVMGGPVPKAHAETHLLQA